MPMIPQAMFTMLACARIGAPHSLIFGGFASKELSVRIDHAKVSLNQGGVHYISFLQMMCCLKGAMDGFLLNFPFLMERITHAQPQSILIIMPHCIIYMCDIT